jgi:DNA-binding transcriptional MerR regulator
LRTVRFVKRAQQLGFSLEEIDSLLGLARGGPQSCNAASSLAAEKIAQFDGKIAHLVAMRQALLQLVASCERPRQRRECPLLDAFGDGSEPISGEADGNGRG